MFGEYESFETLRCKLSSLVLVNIDMNLIGTQCIDMLFLWSGLRYVLPLNQMKNFRLRLV